MTIIITKDGKITKKDKLPFEKEDKLQRYVEEIPAIVPIYDIKDDDAKLLILAREFPTDSGPIDALGIDKDGDIYIIETKRYKNPDKRQVVAQVLDYGASLWTNTTFDEFFSKLEFIIQEKSKVGLIQKLKNYFEIGDDVALTVKDNMKKNLEKGDFMFVVLMDELEDRLKDLISFINIRSKFSIYAVELEYYQHEGYEIMIPKLYGAETKNAIDVKNEARGKWDEQSFFKDAENKIKNQDQLVNLQKLFKFSREIGEIKWGTGTTRGSFAVYLKIASRSWYYVYSDGTLVFNTHMMLDFTDIWKYRDEFRENLSKIGLKVEEDYEEHSPSFVIERWSPVVNRFIEAVKDLIK